MKNKIKIQFIKNWEEWLQKSRIIIKKITVASNLINKSLLNRGLVHYYLEDGKDKTTAKGKTTTY